MHWSPTVTLKALQPAFTAYLLAPPVLKSLSGAQAMVREFRSCVKVEVAALGPPVPNSLYGLCGRKATFNLVPVVHGQNLGAV